MRVYVTIILCSARSRLSNRVLAQRNNPDSFFIPFSRLSYSQDKTRENDHFLLDEITPPDKWEILPDQIEFEEELGRGEFGVVYKATFRKSDEMEALVTETSKWPVSTRKPKAPQVVAVKVLHGKKY